MVYMAKQDNNLIKVEGIVIAMLPRAHFRIKLDNGHEVMAYTSGHIRKNRIRIVIKDRVVVEISRYDTKTR